MSKQKEILNMVREFEVIKDIQRGELRLNERQASAVIDWMKAVAETIGEIERALEDLKK